MARPLAVLAVFLGALCGRAQAEALVYSSAAGAPVVIELFTSQGCSSCPPAERWLSRLAQEPGLWTAVIPLSWHVDYWDDLGWSDVFSHPDYSRRQRAYARSGHLSQVYTPGVLRNGREWRLWRTGLSWGEGPDRDVGVLSLRVDAATAALTFKPGRDAPAGRLAGHVAIVGLCHVTAIARGENRGRTLQEDFVVLGVSQAPLDQAAVVLQLPETGRATAKRLGVVAWLSQGDDPTPVQAVAGWYRNRR